VEGEFFFRKLNKIVRKSLGLPCSEIDTLFDLDFG
jgi:hypothetical protein